MLTGDNERTAKAIGAAAGVDEVVAGVLPDGKEAVIRELQRDGNVAMVGDGINDAPALTRADIGIAIGAGTDVAIDAADVVLMKSRLTDVPAAIRMSRQTIRNIHENLFWAFFYNAICIPLAMGVYGIAMKPVYGAAAMALSSFFVCMNALRLNLFNMHDASKDKPRRKKNGAVQPADGEDTCGADSNDNNSADIRTEDRKETTMKKTMNIEGMMCIHCEARVKKALEAVDGVTEAVVSHEAGTAIVEMAQDIDNEVLKKAVEDQDYAVKGIA
ncbi:MAG: HAD-IC family P-type ATPase, partial [Firmicutes bacterium]|nr:HAD-IC family P-type ATPase [Bacillota bacterium]